MMQQFWNDESGFVVSAELVLVATILVIGLIVGLTEVQCAVVDELNDVGEAIGRLNQSYLFTGFAALKTCGFGFGSGRLRAYTTGSAFFDSADSCDLNECALACAWPTAEYPKGGTCAVGGTVGGTTGGIRQGGAWGGGTGSPSCAPIDCSPR